MQTSREATQLAPVAALPDQVITLHDVAWETYELLLADDEGRRVPRMTYDQGELDLVTPSKPHEIDAATITRLVDIVAATLGIPVQRSHRVPLARHRRAVERRPAGDDRYTLPG